MQKQQTLVFCRRYNLENAREDRELNLDQLFAYPNYSIVRFQKTMNTACKTYCCVQQSAIPGTNNVQREERQNTRIRNIQQQTNHALIMKSY